MHAAGGYPLEFGTISVSDGISMGHEGMHFSLVSRDIIADSVETVMQAERLDGSVLLAGCDKSLPGMLMAAARLDLASVFLYAGSIAPGWVKLEDGTEKDVTIIDAFEAVGACARGLMSREDVDRIERAICPGEGACGGMYTANTMASVAEAIGMSIPGSAAPPSADRRRDAFAHKSGEAVVELLRQGITARQIMTKEAFENAIAVVMAFGGSTNAVLHLLAIAHEAEVDLTLADFSRVAAKVPHLGDLKPFGRYVMNDVDRIGGVPVVMKALLDAGLLHGDCLTVTGKTVAENLADVNPPDPDGKILRALDNPIHKTGGITILHGSLAPEGAVVKSAGFDSDVFEGTARVFERERAAMDALEDGTIVAGDVVVIRYEGPKGGPGMREMLAITGAIKGAGPGQGRPAAHRRSLLRRHHRPVRRARGTRGRRRRPDRVRPGRRPDPARRGQRDARPAGQRRGARGPQGRLGAAAPHVHARRAGQVREARAVGVEGRRADLSDSNGPVLPRDRAVRVSQAPAIARSAARWSRSASRPAGVSLSHVRGRLPTYPLRTCTYSACSRAVTALLSAESLICTASRTAANSASSVAARAATTDSRTGEWMTSSRRARASSPTESLPGSGGIRRVPRARRRRPAGR